MSLSRIYIQGLGVEANIVEAYKWLYLAPQNGDGNATRTLIAVRERLTPAEVFEACRRAEDFQRAFGNNTAKR
jgi:TPR repeat protein